MKEPEFNPTQEGWDTFLALLDPDPRNAGGKFVMLRRKLVSFFEYRGCGLEAEGCAFETIRRVIQLSEGKTIERVEAFTLTVARYIASEFHARQKRLQRQMSPPAPSVSGEERAREEALLGYLDDCMETLSGADRDLITGYYEHQGGEKIKQKKKIASSLGVSTGGLRIRAFRLRKKLEDCVSRRMKQNPEVSTQC